jgi:beta-lactamase class A
MCSTFKFLAAALVLSRVDRSEERLDRRIVYSPQDLVAHSPVTQHHAGPDGLTVGELCEAAMTESDNTAANLLLASFGGPGAVTLYARSLGDEVTRLDRIEPELNQALPGDPRDTTSPAAMASNLSRTVLGSALSEPSRAQLITWLVANRTGDRRLRAGFPPGWRVGDKTGTGMNGAAADIAVVWAPERAPLVVAAYLADSTAPMERRNAVFEDLARILAAVP